MHRSLLLCLLTVILAAQTRPEPAPQALVRRSRASRPDGSEIAFVSGGDIWTVPSAGGEARLLVSHAATESRPVYSPDKTQLAFVSTRTGGGDIYVLTFATGDVRRVTFDDGLGAARRLVARRQVALLLLERPRSVRRHERRLSRRAGGRHADGGQRRPLCQRVLLRRRRPTARRSRCRRAASPRASGGATATATSTRRRSGCAT